MIIAIVAVFHILFGGGALTFDDVRDSAEAVIKDKERAKQVISITDEGDYRYEQFSENLEKLHKQLKAMNRNYDLTREEMDTLSEKAKQNQIEFFNHYITLQFQMKNLVSAEEWQAMHTKKD